MWKFCKRSDGTVFDKSMSHWRRPSLPWTGIYPFLTLFNDCTRKPFLTLLKCINSQKGACICFMGLGLSMQLRRNKMLFVVLFLLWLTYIQASIFSPRNIHPGILQLESRARVNRHRTKTGSASALSRGSNEVGKFALYTLNNSTPSNLTASSSTAPSTESTSKHTHKLTSRYF